MEKQTSYIPLIEQWELYLNAGGVPDVEHFAVWVLTQRKDEMPSSEKKKQLMEYFDTHGAETGNIVSSAKAGYFISRLQKFTKHASKKIFDSLGYSSSEEFAMLALLDSRGECGKKELIHENLLEVTTGMDILKRMLSMGWVIEQVNPEDKRQRLLRITETGKKKLFETYNNLSIVPDVLADLTSDEREVLTKLLMHLDSFHTTRYQNEVKKKR